MGSACTKASPGSVNNNEAEDYADGEDGDTMGQTGPPSPSKGKTFRDRRLSMSQVHDPKANDRSRRLSVYGSGSSEGGAVVEVTGLKSVGAKSIPGVEPVPGGSVAKINQDRAIAIWPFLNDKRCALLGVFDGHGKQGDGVSQFVKDNLPGLIEEHEQVHSKPAVALKESYVACDEELAASTVEASVSGSTAVTVLVKDRTYWVANAGDSRAVIGRWTSGQKGMTAHDVSFDQKPDTPAEMKRIIAAGGHVTPAGTNGSPARVWHNFRGLAMARSIGDHNAATVGVIAEPDVNQYTFDDKDAVMVIASDGVWELLDSQQVIDIVAQNYGSPTESIVDAIIEQAAYMWKVEEGDYRDDISCVIAKLPWLAGEA